jgi:hypothetical protein
MRLPKRWVCVIVTSTFNVVSVAAYKTRSVDANLRNAAEKLRQAGRESSVVSRRADARGDPRAQARRFLVPDSEPCGRLNPNQRWPHSSKERQHLRAPELSLRLLGSSGHTQAGGISEIYLLHLSYRRPLGLNDAEIFPCFRIINLT